MSGVTFAFGTGWTSSYSIAGNPNNLQSDRVFTTGTGALFTISGLDNSKTYNLALIASPDASHDTDFTVGVTPLTATAGSAGSDDNGALTFTDGTTHVLFSGIASSGGVITFTTGKASGSGAGVLFGLQLEAVPEPSTTALLGLGGLALILRRRK